MKYRKVGLKQQIYSLHVTYQYSSNKSPVSFHYGIYINVLPIYRYIHISKVCCMCVFVCLFRVEIQMYHFKRIALDYYCIWGCQTIPACFFNSKENEMYCVPLKAWINSFHQPLFNGFFNALTLFYWYFSFGALFISGLSDSLFYCFNNFGYFEDYFT